MQLFYTNYGAPPPSKGRKKFWKQFGIEQFLEFFNFLKVGTTPEFTNLIEEHSIFTEYKPGEIILNLDDEVKQLLFLVKGNVRFVKYIDGNRQIVNLVTAGAILTNNFNYSEPSQSDVEMETVNKSIVMSIERNIFQQEILPIYKPQFEEAIRQCVLHALNHQRKVTEFLYLSNSDKLVKLHKEFPGIFHEFSMKDIANWVGMQPETMSRLRSVSVKQKA